MKRALDIDDKEIMRESLFPSANKRNHWVSVPSYSKRSVEEVATVLFDHLDGVSDAGLDAKDSELGWKEFAVLCKAAGCDVVKTRILWNQTDRDLSGSLDRSEFFQFCARQDIFHTVAKMAVEVVNKSLEEKKRRMAADEIFDYLDKNKDNMLSWDEFQPLCKGAGCSAQQALEGWNAADADESGELDRSEFRRFATADSCWGVMKRLHGELQYIKLRQVSEVSDTIFNHLRGKFSVDRSGLFNEDELTFDQFAKLCKTAGATTEEKAKDIFSLTDQDGSGTISKREFAIFCARRDVWPVMEKIHAHLRKVQEQKDKEFRDRNSKKKAEMKEKLFATTSTKKD
ncbi:hypothetical protein AAMO2058_001072200 [Amorphochlora amoebiformis]